MSFVGSVQALYRICSVDGCEKKHFGRGYCSAHYERWRRYGDPLAGMTSPGEPGRYFQEIVLNYEGDECLTWPYTRAANGYGYLGHKVVSRRICEETYGPPPTPKHEAAHSCGKGHEGCCAKRHISWKTPAQNQADRLIHGTDNRGSKHPSAKLTENQVRRIIALRGLITQSTLADEYGVGVSTISSIQHRNTWGWLDMGGE